MPKKNLLNTSSYEEVKQLIIENWPITQVDFCKKHRTSKNYLKGVLLIKLIKLYGKTIKMWYYFTAYPKSSRAA